MGAASRVAELTAESGGRDMTSVSELGTLNLSTLQSFPLEGNDALDVDLASVFPETGARCAHRWLRRSAGDARAGVFGMAPDSHWGLADTEVCPNMSPSAGAQQTARSSYQSRAFSRRT